MTRRQRHGHGRIQPSSEARAFLRDDMPAAAKLLLLLQQRGGRRRAARCLVCHTQGKGIHYQVWVPAALLAVEPGEARPQRYVLCTACLGRHQAGTLTDEAIGALLASLGTKTAEEPRQGQAPR